GDDGHRGSGAAAARDTCRGAHQHGVGRSGRGRGTHGVDTACRQKTEGQKTKDMSAHDSKPVAAGPVQESYIVAEGKKRGATRDVRPEAAHDKFYTVLRVHAGDAI